MSSAMIWPLLLPLGVAEAFIWRLYWYQREVRQWMTEDDERGEFAMWPVHELRLSNLSLLTGIGRMMQAWMILAWVVVNQ